MPQFNFKLSGDGRLALALLAESPEGCTKILLLLAATNRGRR